MEKNIKAGVSYSFAEKKYIVNVAGALDCYTCDDHHGGAGVYAWTLKVGNWYHVYRTHEEITMAIRKLSEDLGNYGLILYSGNLNRLYRYLWNHVSRETFITRDGDVLKVNLTGNIEVRDYKRIGLSDLPTVRPVRYVYEWTALTDGEREDMQAVADTITADIEKRIKVDGGAGRIPLTITGYTRRALSRAGVRSYQKIESEEEYKILKKAYTGGVCTANPFYVGEEVRNVDSYDLDSSYISVLLSEKFPCGPARVYRNTMIDLNDAKGLWVAHIYLKNVRLKEGAVVGCISKVRAELSENYTAEAGYITSADVLGVTIASPVWSVIEATYDFDEMAVPVLYLYRAEYIPKNMAETIIGLYMNKEELKGDPSRKYEYKQRKAIVSSVYGLCGVDPMTYGLEEYNSMRKAVPYQYAPFVTAYAERNLYNGIIAAGDSFIYCDTDSVKSERGAMDDFVKWYNGNIHDRILSTLCAIGIDFHEAIMLKNLGAWEKDGEYRRFKTLGQKKYLYEDSVGIHGVISGMKKDFSKRITFPDFYEGAIIPSSESGVIRVRRSEEKHMATVGDRDGKTGMIITDGTYLETPTAYTLGRDAEVIEEVGRRINEYVYTED